MTNTPQGELESTAHTPVGALLNAVAVRNIKGELRKRDLTYDQFAPKVGLNRGTFAQRMACNTPISLPELGAIAHELHLDPSKLLTDD